MIIFKKKSLKLNKITYFVLDETDRMLDMGFEEQIEKIKKSFKTKPQNHPIFSFNSKRNNQTY